MNKIDELEMKIKELSDEIERLKAEKENEVWKPKDGEWYWYINNSGGGLTTVWHGDIVGKSRYALGNVFKTEEEAEFRAEQLKVEAELKRFSRPFIADKDNFILTYNHLRDEIFTECSQYTQYTNFHFPSEEIAQKAIDTVGEARIKKYYFGVED